MNNSNTENNYVQMEIDDIKYDENIECDINNNLCDSSKKHPLARESLILCPRKWSIDDPKTENQYSLNVEVDDADYLNHDPLEHFSDFEEQFKDGNLVIKEEYEAKTD